MGVTPVMLSRAALCVLLFGFALPGPVRAAQSETERGVRWSDLQHAIFGDRVIEDAGDLVAIDAPARAEDAAIVPVAIRVADMLAPDIRGIYLVIDDNPSPLAAHFLFGPLADTRETATRVRIDDYTYLHAIAETSDGRLYATARFIKASGGCSAPASKDQALALQRLGKMKITFRERPEPDSPFDAKLLISHPNNSGLQRDQLTQYFIPADFMQTLEVTYNGQLIFRLESDIAISEDPSFDFRFRPPLSASSGEIRVEILDSSQRHFEQSWPLPAATQM
jgi:sulfur-oxidizing protein SoxY